MRVVYSPKHRVLDPLYEVNHGVQEPASDVPARAESILAALLRDGGFELLEPSQYGTEPILAVHDPGLVAFLEQAWSAWVATGETRPLYPDTLLHPGMRQGMAPAPEPVEIGARMGYWCFDTFTPIVAGTFEAARAAVDVALTTADLVLGGEEAAYGLCRPPGHHAANRLFGGSSYLNNASIAAEFLARRTGDRVAILDVDYHHGNGTQQLFYERADVLYVSLHADPAVEYPYFAGYADEHGSGAGTGFNLNLPLEKRCGERRYLSALNHALDAIDRFPSELLLVSLGLDTYELEKTGGLGLTTEVYEEVGRRVRQLGRRLVIVQEGGYHLAHLGENVRRWLRGLDGADRRKGHPGGDDRGEDPTA